MNRPMTPVKRLAIAAVVAALLAGPAAAQTGAPGKPEGEMRWALYVTLAPAWFDPGEVTVGFLTPFWILYAMHDALVKPMPGNLMTPSLAESWTVSADQRVVRVQAARGPQVPQRRPLHRRRREVQLPALQGRQGAARTACARSRSSSPYARALPPARAVPRLHGVLRHARHRRGLDRARRSTSRRSATRASRSSPIGLGPYKFVSYTPGIELVMEAYEGYWRKVPSVKRLVFKTVPEPTTRAAMLKNGEVDVAYMLDAPDGAGAQARPQLPARLLRRDRRRLPRLLRPVGSEVAVARPPRAAGRQPRHRPQGAQRGRDARAPRRPDGQHVPARRSSSRCRCQPYAYDPGEGQAAPRRGGLSQRLRRRRLLPATRPTSRRARRSSATSARSASA